MPAGNMLNKEPVNIIAPTDNSNAELNFRKFEVFANRRIKWRLRDYQLRTAALRRKTGFRPFSLSLARRWHALMI